MYIFYFLFQLQSVEILLNGTVACSVPYSFTFASCSKKNYVVTEALIANIFVFLDIYVAAHFNLGFTICGSNIEQVWPPLVYWGSKIWQEVPPDIKSKPLLLFKRNTPIIELAII